MRRYAVFGKCFLQRGRLTYIRNPEDLFYLFSGKHLRNFGPVQYSGLSVTPYYNLTLPIPWIKLLFILRKIDLMEILQKVVFSEDRTCKLIEDHQCSRSNLKLTSPSTYFIQVKSSCSFSLECSLNSILP